MMAWRLTLRLFIIWAATLTLASGIIYAMTSTYGRLMDVTELGEWLEENRVGRYALSLLVAFALKTVWVHLRALPASRGLEHRHHLKSDMHLGYRIGLLWFLVMIVLMNISSQNVIVNLGWVQYGIVSLGSMIIIASLEHWVWRGWLYPLMKETMPTLAAMFLSSLGWTLQRCVVFEIWSPAAVMSMLCEGVLLLWLMRIIGFGGAWTFLLMWMGALHGILGISFLGHNTQGILFVQLMNADQGKGHAASMVMETSLLPATALFISLMLVYAALPWWRKRTQNKQA